VEGSARDDREDVGGRRGEGEQDSGGVRAGEMGSNNKEIGTQHVCIGVSEEGRRLSKGESGRDGVGESEEEAMQCAPPRVMTVFGWVGGLMG